MFTKFLPHFVLGLWTVIILHLPSRAIALTPLTKAEVQKLHNIVQFIPKDNRNKRPARQSETITPGEGVSTGRSSLADLRFNDGSLARLGEQAVFKFVPKQRNFQLSNGTILLLIPPGQGRTQIETPNAAAAIRGSALFVRYNPKTDTTIIGALTNSGIEVFNQKASQNHVLEAGQLIVVVGGEFQGLYDFDLRNFYETSNLIKGLNLTNQNSNAIPDPALAGVQAEINAAIAIQSPLTGQGVVENPSFLRNSSNTENIPNQDLITGNSPVNNTKENLPVDSFIETGEKILEDQIERVNNDRQRNPGRGDNAQPGSSSGGGREGSGGGREGNGGGREGNGGGREGNGGGREGSGGGREGNGGVSTPVTTVDVTTPVTTVEISTPVTTVDISR